MKNWIVDVEQKKKSSTQSARTERRKKAAGIETKKKNRNTLENAVKYLLNDKHNRHCLTKITDLNNARLARDNILEEYDLMREKHGKGISNIATSFCLSLPADLYHPSVDEWNKIYNSTIKNFVNEINKDLEKNQKKLMKVDPSNLKGRKLEEYHLNKIRFSQRLDLDEVKKLTVAVIHDDREKPLIVGKTNGSHLNILMSNIHNGEVIKYLSQKGGIAALKKSYDLAVKSELGLDCKNYIPYNSRPDNNKLKDFYVGETDLNLVEINEDTPHRNKLVKQKKVDFEGENKPIWLKNKEELILRQDQNKIIDNRRKNLNRDTKIINERTKKIKSDNNLVIKKRKDLQKDFDQKKADLEATKKEIKTVKDKLLDLYTIIRDDFKEWSKSLFMEVKKEKNKELSLKIKENLNELEELGTDESKKVVEQFDIFAENQEKAALELRNFLDEKEKVSNRKTIKNKSKYRK